MRGRIQIMILIIMIVDGPEIKWVAIMIALVVALAVVALAVVALAVVALAVVALAVVALAVVALIALICGIPVFQLGQSLQHFRTR
ncbi:MAG: hypothetical protein EBU84_05080 [Actinobacteria bacterium]|nr:hypothetical protein [Actinomycetota bacterium]